MFYLYAVVSVLLTSGAFCLTKKYQLMAGSARKSTARFSFLTSFATFLIFWAWNGFRIEFSLWSFAIALGAVLCGQAYTFIGFQLMKHGSYAMYTTFLMSGGMVLPFIYGITFLSEPLSPGKIAGIVLLSASVALLPDYGGSKGRRNARLLPLYILVFLLNGSLSILSKIHQSGAAADRLSTVPYSTLLALITTVICGGWYLLECLLARRAGSAQDRSANLSRILLLFLCYAALGALSTFLQLYSATGLDASILYPLITGGTVVLSALAGRLVFQERQNKKNIILTVLCFLAILLFIW